MRISDWSSGVCSSDLLLPRARRQPHRGGELRVAAMLEPRSRPLFLAPSSTSCSGLTRASRATAQTVALDPRLEAEGDERGGGLAGARFSYARLTAAVSARSGSAMMSSKIGRASRRERVCQYG